LNCKSLQLFCVYQLTHDTLYCQLIIWVDARCCYRLSVWLLCICGTEQHSIQINRQLLLYCYNYNEWHS